ncbi:MAG: class I adenylate-forming enzyme family protein [Xanthobacteraceae bacterium]
MPRTEPASLRDELDALADSNRFLFAANGRVALGDLAHGSGLDGRLGQLAGRSVLVATNEQLTTALALIELDGIARRITLCPGDLKSEHLVSVVADAGVDAIVSDGDGSAFAALGAALHVTCRPQVSPTDRLPRERLRTEWVLLTSGTTGRPKLVMHSQAGLTAPSRAHKPDGPQVWGTFYDIRRYGGLQILFRALLGGGSFVLSCCGEPFAEHLARLGAHGATHVSGTPSHWRRLVMSPAAHLMSPRYVRLSGEIADQAILDGLRAVYPQAVVAHAYASTEAGVGFAVNDGREGFPADLIGPGRGEVEMKILDGTLRIRSVRTASRYVGEEAAALMDADGFVDTGDIVELRSDRYYFIGRQGGIINVGGLKVHPEEVEAVINRHPAVRMSLVRSRKNPITGAIVVADVVLRADPEGLAGAPPAEVKREILQACQAALPEHKIPAAIQFVASLEVAATGKLARRYA